VVTHCCKTMELSALAVSNRSAFENPCTSVRNFQRKEASDEHHYTIAIASTNFNCDALEPEHDGFNFFFRIQMLI